MLVSVTSLPVHTEPDELYFAMQLLPQWRRDRVGKMRSLAARDQSIQAFMLLTEALDVRFGIHHVPEFAYGPHGKPFLAEYPEAHFNISHCPKAAVCVVADTEVGIDVESASRKLKPGVMERYYSDGEAEQVMRSENPDLEFTKLWTQKEAVAKCTGEGISDKTKYCLLPLNMHGLELETTVDKDRGVVYSVCWKKAN